MTIPVFEEYEPPADCGCAGCCQQRRAAALGLTADGEGHPAAHGARRMLVLATAAGVALGGGAPGAANAAGPAHAPATTGADHDPPTPQGGTGSLYGVPGGMGDAVQTGRPALRSITRAEIIDRAKLWVNAKVPYSMKRYWSDGYRQDCSGYVSMAWNLGSNEWTGSLAAFGVRITRDELEPGDMLLFHNPDNPTNGSHVTLFGGWTDSTHTQYIAYEQTRPRARRLATPYAYWNNSSRYVPYRYKGVTDGSGGAEPAVPAYPGEKFFGPGASNAYVTRLGEMLVERGGRRFYRTGPGPRWAEADRLATQAFQRAQGWQGPEADGLPGPHTWRLLVTGTGNDIPAVDGDGGGEGSTGGGGAPSPGASAFPGREYFRPGQSNMYVDKLGRQLVEKGFGKHYMYGPGPRWTEEDRRNVEAFQRAQGWRGAEADGYPGPETWRRLFA
ncbi:peptidoglycan-binding protein [Streptomyces spiramyceticus]|uniref:peptidoglycan-binding protein n=1 Tax=Streptomyces spiramyceticus TaxID=299717 RepID=UPI00237AD967|nr:peptidoglycan-binding protein [Streptomyces spiramyceticus]